MDSKLVAIFSSSATGTMLAITREGDDMKALTFSQPSAGDDPHAALIALGYRLAHPSQARDSLRPTMKATGYAKLYVVPA